MGSPSDMDASRGAGVTRGMRLSNPRTRAHRGRCAICPETVGERARRAVTVVAGIQLCRRCAGVMQRMQGRPEATRAALRRKMHVPPPVVVDPPGRPAA
jgi:hypothetical protein